MRVVVIGASGFLGKYVISLLQNEGVECALFDKRKHSLFNPSSMKALLKSADSIVYLAGRNKEAPFHEMVRVNVLGTERLMQAVCEYAPKARVIFASTILAYLEDDEYGQTKKIAEEIIEEYGKQNHIKSTILRFSNLYGIGAKPYRNSVIATFVENIRKGKTVKITGGASQKRDFLYVVDAARAVRLSLTHSSKNSMRLDICTGKLTSVEDVVRTIKRLTQKKITVEHLPGRQYDHPYALRKTYTSAKKMLQWTPQTTMEEGLQKILLHNSL